MTSSLRKHAPSATRITLASTVAAALLATSAAAQVPVGDAAEGVRQRLLERIAQLPGAEVGIAIHDLASGRRLEINGDTVFHAASTMKIPVLIDLEREVDAGRFPADLSLLLVNRYYSIVDGSPYELSASDDSDSLVYTWIGERIPVARLAERMITHSSNLATNAIIAVLDPERITETMRTFGARHTKVLRGVEDNVAYRAGLNNVTTANDLAAMLVALEQGRAASPRATSAIRDVLSQQAFNDEIPAGLPPDTRIAHKTGSITATLHDAAIVYPSERAPFVLVVLTRGIPDGSAASALIADLATITWSWLVGDTTRSESPE